MSFYLSPRRWMSLVAVLVIAFGCFWWWPWQASVRSGEATAIAVAGPLPPTAQRSAAASEASPKPRTRTFDRDRWEALSSIPLAQLTAWLEQEGRTAAALVAAWELTHDPSLEAELAEKHADDPMVCLTLLNGKGPEGKVDPAWVERLRKAAPDHPLPDCLDAAAAAKSGDFLAVQTALELALNKTGRRDQFEVDRMSKLREAAAAAGMDALDAATVPALVFTRGGQANYEVMTGASSLAKSGKELAKDGDSEGAKDRAAAAISLVSHAEEQGGRNLLQTLVRDSILGAAVKILPPDTLMGDTGQTLGEAVAQKLDYKALVPDPEVMQQAMASLTTNETIHYWDLYIQQGEVAAILWVKEKTTSTPAVPVK